MSKINNKVINDEFNNSNNIASHKVQKRDANFELLRIISMFMIVTLHLLYNEGALSTKFMESSYIASWTLESFAIVAANIYVLISGYFLVKSNFSFKKVIKLWIDVIFYSCGITIIFILFKNILNYNFNFSLRNMLLVFLPVTSGEYWFVTNYILLYLLSPYLNKLFNMISKKEFEKLLILEFITFVALKFFMPLSNTFDKTGGYGIMWFVILYSFAAYIRLFYNLKINKYFYLASYVISSFIIFGCKILFTNLENYKDIFSSLANGMYDYNNLFVFISSISLFLFFKELKISDTCSKLICTLSKASFGVYLIHEQFFARGFIWTKLIHVNDVLDSRYLVLYVILNASIIYIACTVIELIRLKIFKMFSFKKIIK